MKVFLSHNSADKPAVEALARVLKAEGISCWLDKWNLIPGDPWDVAIEDALATCDVCGVFFGPSGVGPWHNEEMRVAIRRRVNDRERRLRVLPVLLPGGRRLAETQLPSFLQGTTWVEFRHSLDETEAIHRLKCGVLGIAPEDGPDNAPFIGRSPYVGLKPFRQSDARLFFGRDALLQQILNRQRDQFGTPREHRFLALIGASGSGKSSLAAAGLLPAILERGEVPDGNHWLCVQCRPGSNPWESLQVALASHSQLASRLNALDAIVKDPEQESSRLNVLARLALHEQPDTHRLIVFVDQFEEFFTLYRQEQDSTGKLDATRRRFLDNLLYPSTVPDSRVLIVLTMRADFYGHCATYAALRAAVSENQILIGPMSPGELREVIEHPAQRCGCEVEPALVDRLIDDMEHQPGALPFLQHALFKLWEARDGRRLTAAAYRTMGSLEGALDAHAEGFFAGLTSDRQELLRNILLDLIQLGEGAADTKRRRFLDQLVHGNRQDFRAFVAELADEKVRLIVTNEAAGREQIELAHEALITGWKRLHSWIEGSREAKRQKDRIEAAAHEWIVAEPTKRDDFLWRGARLEHAEFALSRSTLAVNEPAERFLRASREQREREIADNKVRQERELAQAQALAAEQKQRADDQGRSAFRLRVFAVVLALLVVTAGLFWLSARREASISLATQLGIQAELLGSRESGALDTSLLLAIESLSRYRTVAADMAIRRGIEFMPTRTQKFAANSSFSRIIKSGDGSLLAVIGSGNVVEIHSAKDGVLVKEIRLPGKPEDLAFATNEHLITLIRSNPTKVIIWALPGGDEIATCIPDPESSSVSVSPSGLQFATDGAVTKVQIWNALDGKQISELPHEFINKPDAMVRTGIQASFSPIGDTCLTRSLFSREVVFWNTATGMEIFRIEIPGVRGCEFSQDGKSIVCGFENQTFGRWDLQTKKRISAISSTNLADSFSRNGSDSLLAFPEPGSIAVCDGHTLAKIGSINVGYDISSVLLSFVGDRALTTEHNGTLRVWDLRRSRELGRIIVRPMVGWFADKDLTTISVSDGSKVWDYRVPHVGIDQPMWHEKNITDVAFSSDNRLLASASEDKEVCLRSADSGDEIRRFLHPEHVTKLLFAPGGNLLATATAKIYDDPASSGTAHLWKVSDGRQMAVLKHGGDVTSLAFNKDGSLLATGCTDGIYRIWETQSGNELQQLKVSNRSVISSVAFIDSRELVALDSTLETQIWDGKTGKMVKELKPGGGFMGIRVSPDGKYLITTGSDPQRDDNDKHEVAVIWDCSNWNKVCQVTHDNTILAGAFSPDGQIAATGGFDKTVKVWQTNSGKVIAQFDHPGMIHDLTFLPDGNTLISGCEDGTARIWDVEAGREVGRIEHKEDVVCVAASPDGRLIASGSRDGSLKLSRFDTRELTAAAKARVTRKLTELEWKRFFGDRRYSPINR